jgi:hypothetical protein
MFHLDPDLAFLPVPDPDPQHWYPPTHYPLPSNCQKSYPSINRNPHLKCLAHESRLLDRKPKRRSYISQTRVICEFRRCEDVNALTVTPEAFTLIYISEKE